MLEHTPGEDCQFAESVDYKDVLKLVRLFRTGGWKGEKKWEAVRLALWILGCATHYAETGWQKPLSMAYNRLDDRMDILLDLAQALETMAPTVTEGSLASTSEVSDVAVFAWTLLRELEVFE